jgi:hypothetical protein
MNAQLIINQLKHNQYCLSPDGDRAITAQTDMRKKTTPRLFRRFDYHRLSPVMKMELESERRRFSPDISEDPAEDCHKRHE